MGSLEEGETAPTVEALPELVVETETQAFERQERPSGDLLLGERRVVQAGEAGRVRHLIEVDAKGNRTLLKTEVVKEAVAEITEVGTKVESRVQPLDGSGDLVLEKPELEVKEEAVAFKHQERPTGELLLGERRLVQAGEAGQIRHLIEVDAKGHRTLLKTEVVKEAVTEIIEVGTKVESRVQPLEGPKVLEVKKPNLVVEEEVLAFGREERENSNLLAGEHRLVQAGVEGLRRNLIEVDAEGNRSLKGTELIKETVTEIVEVGTKVESRVQPLDGVKDLTISNPALVIEEEKVAYGHEERVNPSLQAGERRIVQAGVEGLRRNLVEVDAEGNRSLKGTELVKETVTEIVEIGPKVDVQADKTLAPAPVAQAAKQEATTAEAQAEKPEGKQLPSTGEGVDANLLALGLVGVLGGFGLLAQKKKED